MERILFEKGNKVLFKEKTVHTVLFDEKDRNSYLNEK